ncbi:hypothetical protein DW199_20280 [Klebsiella pneumoniae]|uniref:hypothetical protein n=1 Tax=Klebsiella pneumoniae complex TaxID=3390273 RepID=UPI00070CBC2C|nr:hypothetical protein [Klebsiella pneumoniae]ELA1219937.1 hypothetical protein [Klebsiella pneumoniae]MBD0035940.1 hypothetical protein [Klebsiella pneumoniae]MCB8856956.1 hypothetical protein [Klebsiella pneumoniae]MCB8865946.1 hypothetical protein [Klebsiella pneumoniae]OKN60357.1 hypothetical protein AM423_002692 [Klebsiella pneumoniae]
MINLIKARLIQADLKEIDREFEEKGFGSLFTMVLFKQALISIANLVDFEHTIRMVYKEHPQLSQHYRQTSAEFDFAKYLRNKFVGHIKPELIEKALEWRPEIRFFLNKTSDSHVMGFYNMWILETAINSYVDSDGKHKIFDSETALDYPPDNTRFLIYMTKIIKSGISFLEEFILAMDIEYENLCNPDLEEQLRLGGIAGKTDFAFIKK